MKDISKVQMISFVFHRHDEKSSPDYCVKSKAIVFSFTFDDSLSKPFHFFDETSMVFYLHIRGGLSKAFHFDSPPWICDHSMMEVSRKIKVLLVIK